MKTKIWILTACFAILLASANAEEEYESVEELEITVEARKRSESYFDVPETMSVFTSKDLEATGAKNIQDIANQTPNLILRDSYRGGVNYLTMRGIGTSELSLAPVAFLIDGVPMFGQDFLNMGLFDVEQIEILKGPQGSLYGSGAIAGAILVKTKKPTRENSGKIITTYASGNDRRVGGVVSGPIGESNFFYRLGGISINKDGLIKDINGDRLDFEESNQFQGSLLYEGSDVEIRLVHSSLKLDGGAFYMNRQIVSAGTPLDFDNWSIDIDTLGSEKRKLKNSSLKIDWFVCDGTFTAITGYSDLDQSVYTDADWTSAPAYSLLFADYKTKKINQEFRFTSSDELNFRWTIGSSFQEGVFDKNYDLTKPAAAPIPSLKTYDEINKNKAYAYFGQTDYDITEKLTLTTGLRFDSNTYKTDYYEQHLVNGTSSVNEEETDQALQTKISLAYKFTENTLGYITYADGFRSGFFNAGGPAKEETSQNYEIGFKGSFDEKRGKVQLALFHIDYSDQQFSNWDGATNSWTTTNIPETDIDGIEFDTSYQIDSGWSIGTSLGFISAKVKDGTESPNTPDYTANLWLGYETELTNNLITQTRLDYRKEGSSYLETNERAKIDSKEYINLNTELKYKSWTLGLFGENLLNTKRATQAAFNSTTDGVYLASRNLRRFGVNLAYSW